MHSASSPIESTLPEPFSGGGEDWILKREWSGSSAKWNERRNRGFWARETTLRWRNQNRESGWRKWEGNVDFGADRVPLPALPFSEKTNVLHFTLLHYYFPRNPKLMTAYDVATFLPKIKYKRERKQFINSISPANNN